MSDYRRTYSGQSVLIPKIDSSPTMMEEGELYTLYSPVHIWNTPYKVGAEYSTMKMLWTVMVQIGQEAVQTNLTDELLADSSISQISEEIIDMAASKTECPNEVKDYLKSLLMSCFTGLDNRQ